MIYYIFLDIDGVLNDEVHIEKCYEMNGGYPMSMNHVPFDPKALTNLMNLVKKIREVGAPRIVLSSTWRLHEIDMEIVSARIAEYGLRLFDKTPYIHSQRGMEIKAFLERMSEEHPVEEYPDEEFKFVILDDDKFDIETIYPDNLVYVNRIYGLSVSDVNKALKILDIGVELDGDCN